MIRTDSRGTAPLWVLLDALLLAVLIFGVSGWILLSTPEKAGWTPKKILIPRGTSTRDAARIFAEAGVLRTPLGLRAIAFVTGTSRTLMSGEYIFEEPPSTYLVWRKMVRGEVVLYTVVVPEGSNIFDIARIVQDEGLLPASEVVAAASDPEEVRHLGLPGPTAEGYLFPDTYLFVKPVTPHELLTRMTKRFDEVFEAGMKARAGQRGLSVRETVTIASIIEKETGREDERAIISAVIRNRLKLGMPLQMDPTVVYGSGRFGKRIRRVDLKDAANPYNTYTKKGIPPGPISNPGKASLDAALAPADSPYIYFVSRNDRSHIFSVSLSDHAKAVLQFQPRDDDKDDSTDEDEGDDGGAETKKAATDSPAAAR